MKLTMLSKKAVKMEFDDILDFVQYAEDGPKDGYSRDTHNVGWAGGTFEDAVEQGRTGNPELVTSMFDGVNVLNAMIEQDRIGEIRDVTGEYFDVSDYLSGEPECFRREEYRERGQVIPVYANFSMDFSVEGEIIRNRGCGIVALCDELQRSGFIVDLHLVHSVEDFGAKYKTIYTSINVRLDPLDLDTAAFVLGNPLCLRRLGFATREHVTENSCPWNYGTPSEYDLSEIFDSGLSGFYFTSSLHNSYHRSNFVDLASTKEHIMKMIEEFKSSAEQVILG